jgi:hypothetical protein
MVPTLGGRLQTRILVLAVIGGLLTALITPVLHLDGSPSQKYQATYLVLAAVIVVGGRVFGQVRHQEQRRAGRG